MDPMSDMTNQKRKKYTKRSFLTIDKKSKRYWINRSCQRGSGPSITDESSTSDTTSENESLSTHDKSNSYEADNTPAGYCQSKSDAALRHQQHDNYSQMHQKTKSIQVKPFVKAVGVQASCLMKMRSVQTLHNKSIWSSGVQTEQVKKRNSHFQKLSHGELWMVISFFTGTSWAWSWHQYFSVDLLL